MDKGKVWGTEENRVQVDMVAGDKAEDMVAENTVVVEDNNFDENCCYRSRSG